MLMFKYLFHVAAENFVTTPVFPYNHNGGEMSYILLVFKFSLLLKYCIALKLITLEYRFKT